MSSTPYKSLASLRRDELRVVRISPGRWNDPILANLITCTFHLVSTFCPYTALSYVWGAASVTDTICLDGVQFNVTLNLLCALKHLRDSEKAILLWIDALCINQQDEWERSQQVRIMQNIYQNAQQVIVFLGDGHGHRFDHSKSRLPPDSPEKNLYGDGRDRDFLDGLLKKCQGIRLRRKISSISADTLAIGIVRGVSDSEKIGPFFKELMKAPKDARSHMFECLRAFVVSPWWARIWVVQEVTVNNNVLVRYGNVITSWQVFFQAADTWSMPQTRELAHRVALEAENMKVLDLFENQVAGLERTRRRWRSGGGTPLVRLLQEFSHRKASDDRDKVYALLSLAKPEQQACIQLDYSGDVLKTYRNTALALLKEETSLAFWSGDQRRKNHRDLPSWVPDWSTAFDHGDRRRMGWLDCYEANRGWTLALADTEMTYWSAVSMNMERLLVSLTRLGGRLPGSLRTFLRQYTATLEQLKERFTPTEIRIAAKEPNLLQYLNLCREHGTLSVPHQRALAQCMDLLQPGSASVINAVTVKTKGRNISFWLDLQERHSVSNSQWTPKSFILDYDEDKRLVEEWYDEHIMRHDLGMRRAAIRKLISQCEQLSALCTETESVNKSRRLFNSSYIFRSQTCWLGGTQQEKVTLDDYENYRGLRLTPALKDALIIQAIHVDRVTECGPRLIGWADKKSAFSVLRNWFKLSQQGRSLSSDSEHSCISMEAGSLRAFAETLLGGLRWCSNSHNKAAEVDLGPLEDWLRLLLDSEDPPPPPSPFFEAIEVATDGRVFFVTKYGSIGLGPASLLSGDVIYILPSGRTQFALRWRTAGKSFSKEHTAKGDLDLDVDATPRWIEEMSSNQYELVGDCYLNRDGISDIEAPEDEEAAIDGSLPFELLGSGYLKDASPKVETIMLI